MSKAAVTIGIILDGNRRWAKEHEATSLEGHKKGSERVKDIISWAHEAGVKEVVLYAFSTENWNRPPEEVTYLMKLFEETCDEWAEEMKKRNGRVRFIGERSRLSASLKDKMDKAEQETQEGTQGTLWVALSYGGRSEIIAGVNQLLKSGVSSVDENDFAKTLWSSDMANPDLIIRTGGEKRLSNFLTWQSVYSELFFTDTKLPDFTKEEFVSILSAYSERERRHGR
jgi:undecaprenyl diphosphate synthase